MNVQASMLSERRGDQLTAARKQAAEKGEQPADRPHPTATTTNGPTSPKARPKNAGRAEAADERTTTHRKKRRRGKAKQARRREGRRRERRGRGERKRGRARGRRTGERPTSRRKGRTTPGRQGAQHAEKDNRQPQEHKQERQEDKLVPTTTQKSNSLCAQGRDGRVVVRNRSANRAATEAVVKSADIPTERTQHSETGT